MARMLTQTCPIQFGSFGDIILTNAYFRKEIFLGILIKSEVKRTIAIISIYIRVSIIVPCSVSMFVNSM